MDGDQAMQCIEEDEVMILVTPSTEDQDHARPQQAQIQNQQKKQLQKPASSQSPPPPLLSRSASQATPFARPTMLRSASSHKLSDRPLQRTTSSFNVVIPQSSQSHVHHPAAPSSSEHAADVSEESDSEYAPRKKTAFPLHISIGVVDEDSSAGEDDDTESDSNYYEDGTQFVDDDVVMSDCTTDSESEATDDRRPSHTQHTIPQLTLNTDSTVLGKDSAANSNSINNANRYPSPVPTEPEDPDPEYILKQLSLHKIKVRDFAYPPYQAPQPHIPSQLPPVTPPPRPSNERRRSSYLSPPDPNSPSSASHPPSPVMSPDSLISLHARLPPLTPEIFDPFHALGEFEFRVTQSMRMMPIPGKITRRLLELGWLSEHELYTRCNPEDIASLKEFDQKCRKRVEDLRKAAVERGEGKRAEDGSVTGLDVNPIPDRIDEYGNRSFTTPSWLYGYRSDGAYPYRVLRWNRIPGDFERRLLADEGRVLFVTVDRAVRTARLMEQMRERERREAEQAERDMEERKKEEEKRKQLEKEKEERETVKPTVQIQVTTPDTGANASTEPTVPISKKRSPQQAWADESPVEDESGSEDNEAKRLRLARSQSQILFMANTTPVSKNSTIVRSPSPAPNTQITSHSNTHSNNGGTLSPVSESQEQGQSQLQLQSEAGERTGSPCPHTQLQPPEKQYPAPPSAYDPALYPDARGVIESQTQSQTRSSFPPSYAYYQQLREGSQSHSQSQPQSPPKPQALSRTASQSNVGRRSRSQSQDPDGLVRLSTSPPDSGAGADEEDARPNALKRSPKKGLKRGLTRGRTLMQICSEG